MPRGRAITVALGALLIAVTAGGASSASPGAGGAQTIDVYPIAGTPTANPDTGISFRGATSLQGLTVTGSQSGRHSGRMVVHPDGRGFSFLPDHPFEKGEQVTVRGAGRLTGEGADGAVSFGILSPPPRRHLLDRPTGDPGGTPAGVQSFRTRPDLRPPNLAILRRLPGASSDDLFLGVKAGPGQDGPMIRDYRGRLIWFRPVPDDPVSDAVISTEGYMAAHHRRIQHNYKPPTGTANWR